MKHLVLVSLLGSVTLAGAAPVQAENEQWVVVELFTSQGCSACPPADALIQQIATHPRVLALSLHVDYWDYIGWPDHLAIPEAAARQRAYARANGSTMVYTPQMVIGGLDEVPGTKPMKIAERLADHLSRPEGPVQLSLRREGSAVAIEARSTTPGPPLSVALVRYLPQVRVAIERGENAGQMITYVNVVTSWQILGDWTGEAPLSLRIEAPGPEETAIILQEPGPGAIHAAASTGPEHRTNAEAR